MCAIFAKHFLLESANGVPLSFMPPLRLEKGLKIFLDNGAKYEKLRNGKLLVIVETQDQSNLLLRTKDIDGIAIKVEKSKNIGLKKGVITIQWPFVGEREREEELLTVEERKYLCVQGVRTSEWLGGNSILLCFNTEELPDKVKIGKESIKVRPYIPKVLRCYRCNKIGHMANKCSLEESEATCVNCGESHEIVKGVQCNKPPKCVNCGSSAHHSASRNCPKVKLRHKLIKSSVINKIPVRELRQQHFTASLPTPSLSYAQALRANTSSRMKNNDTQTMLSISDPRVNEFLKLTNIEQEGDKIIIPTKYKRSSVKSISTQTIETQTDNDPIAIETRKRTTQQAKICGSSPPISARTRKKMEKESRKSSLPSSDEEEDMIT